MNINQLRDYEEAERGRARQWCAQAINEKGIIEKPEYIYADKFPLLLPRALHRPGAPLSNLSLLYRQTFVLVPPTTRRNLVARFGGLSFDDFLELARHNIVIPIIGRPQYYADMPHLDPLLQLNPPSIWARGTELIKDAGFPGYFEEARRLLPLAAISRAKWVKEKWRRQFSVNNQPELKKRIEDELATNYANLCAFGLHDYAISMAKNPNPSHIAQELLNLNEIAVYPKLMAGGGTSVYRVKDRPEISYINERIAAQIGNQGPPEYIHEAFEQLAHQLELRFPTQISAQALAEFHNSSNSERLRQVLLAIETTLANRTGVEIDHLLNITADFQRIVQEALAQIDDYGEARRKVKRAVAGWIFSVGGLTGGLIAYALTGNWQGVGIAGGIGAGVGLSKLSEHLGISEALVAAIAERKFGPIVANLWWLRHRNTPNVE